MNIFILENFKVFTVNSLSRKNFFLKYISYYYKKYNNKNNCIGIDYEFYNKNISLIQFGFYEKTRKYIFILDPNIFSNEENQIIINLIYISNIWKILHGSESLDIPYLYNLLGSNENKITCTKKIIDTKFLCEYDTFKCSLYNSLLKYNVINNQKYEELVKLNKNIGKVYKLNWNLNNIKFNIIKYAAYDVLYLKQLLKSILKSSSNKTHIKINVQLLHLIYFIKDNIIKLEELPNITNIKKIYEKIIDKNINNISKFLSINYFKTTLIYIIKNIIVNIISDFTYNIFDVLEEYKFTYIYKYFYEIKLQINNNEFII